MKITLLSTLGVCLAAVAATAQNPIIRDQYTADPTARVFNNKVYLYPSHDIVPPQGQRPDSYSMWAPDCVERGGKYYFYFPSTPRGAMRGFAVGVAVADSPEGPFVPEPEPIKGINGIDPCVLQASDGNAYIFWGAGRCAKLKPSMKELADDTPKETVRWGEREFEMMGVNCLKDLPNRQAEGPFAFEANGWYYLTYPYVRENTEVLGYAMSKHPMGPYEKKVILEADFDQLGYVGQGTIVDSQWGDWYGIIFQDRGGVGRLLTLMPCRWIDGWPMLGSKFAVFCYATKKAGGYIDIDSFLYDVGH